MRTRTLVLVVLLIPLGLWFFVTTKTPPPAAKTVKAKEEKASVQSDATAPTAPFPEGASTSQEFVSEPAEFEPFPNGEHESISEGTCLLREPALFRSPATQYFAIVDRSIDLRWEATSHAPRIVVPATPDPAPHLHAVSTAEMVLQGAPVPTSTLDLFVTTLGTVRIALGTQDGSPHFSGCEETTNMPPLRIVSQLAYTLVPRFHYKTVEFSVVRPRADQLLVVRRSEGQQGPTPTDDPGCAQFVRTLRILAEFRIDPEARVAHAFSRRTLGSTEFRPFKCDDGG